MRKALWEVMVARKANDENAVWVAFRRLVDEIDREVKAQSLAERKRGKKA